MLKTIKINTIFKNKYLELQNNNVVDEVTNKSFEHIRLIEKETDYPGAVAICKFEDRLLLINNYRYGINRMSLEFPRGYVEKGETLEECAIRELFEETGVIFNPTVDSIKKLGEVAVSSSIMATMTPFYLIEIKQSLPEIHLQKEENIEDFKWESIDNIINLIKENKIVDSFTICGIGFSQLFR
ncbi:NUDIX hydrolase [Gallibacterium melopsittaci]|uniref:GDP-mannose pyrophosphatase n=1 Tax=Gallibacterium melopsittaci TaxID=516063 RepID=A0ABV6HW46_9PAST